MKKLIALILLVYLAGWSLGEINASVPTFGMPTTKKVILLDAGHGGWDPGMVGSGNVLEKDLNLKIAAKLQAYLEQSGAFVVNTRTQDEALGERKRSDMAARKELSETGRVDLLISIHQNSYTGETISGAQVFYYTASESSKRLATLIQNELKDFVQPSNKRAPKADSSLYLLKQTIIPAVIIECGFLSNPEELQSLTEDEYQERIAWAVYLAVVKYFDTEQVTAKKPLYFTSRIGSI